jgi:hypothetical protein
MKSLIIFFLAAAVGYLHQEMTVQSSPQRMAKDEQVIHISASAFEFKPNQFTVKKGRARGSGTDKPGQTPRIQAFSIQYTCRSQTRGERERSLRPGQDRQLCVFVRCLLRRWSRRDVWNHRGYRLMDGSLGSSPEFIFATNFFRIGSLCRIFEKYE